MNHDEDSRQLDVQNKKPYSAPQLARFGQVRQLTAGGSGLTSESKAGPVKNARP